jgi:hypothetical protein
MPRGIFFRTIEYREKLRKAAMGRIFSLEVRLKISRANKGTKPAPQTVEASIRARKGKHLTEEHKKKIGRAGEKNWSWKGDDASYWAKHIWINSHLVDPRKCESCGTTENLQWSNKNHRYRRIKKDWQRLCVKCHRKHDDIKFGKRISWNKGKSMNGLA